MSVPVWIAVAAIGAVGALARFVIDAWASSRSDRDFPLGTFVINISGSLLLGLITGLALTGSALVVLGTAGIGSYTTFSTWMLETHRLGEDGELAAAGANILLSVAAGIGAVALGRTVGRHL